MTTCTAHTGVLSKANNETKLFAIDWSAYLNTGLGTTATIKDTIATSTWAFDVATPAATGAIVASDFDPISAKTWLTVSGGADGDVFWINNTITTAGADIGGKTTPSQTCELQLRIRVFEC